MIGIGVDIGGTSVKIGLVNNEGEILDKITFNTPKDFYELVNAIKNNTYSILKNSNLSISDICGIGIGCPGLIDSNGVVVSSSNFEFKNAPLKGELTKRFRTNISVCNDANASTLAEKEFGIAKEYNNVIFLTLGTGVGGGIILNNELFNGGDNSGVELGHFTLNYNGKKCGCGRKGCFEQYASANALINQTKELMLKNKQSVLWKIVSNDINKVNGKTAFDGAKKGDETAKKIIDRYVEYLSNGIMSLFNVYRPEIFIIGGGLSAQGSYLTDKIYNYCKKYHFGYEGVKPPIITTALLGNDAGIIGAYALVK